MLWGFAFAGFRLATESYIDVPEIRAISAVLRGDRGLSTGFHGVPEWWLWRGVGRALVTAGTPGPVMDPGR
jgi:hypothetical protein